MLKMMTIKVMRMIMIMQIIIMIIIRSLLSPSRKAIRLTLKHITSSRNSIHSVLHLYLKYKTSYISTREGTESRMVESHKAESQNTVTQSRESQKTVTQSRVPRSRESHKEQSHTHTHTLHWR